MLFPFSLPHFLWSYRSWTPTGDLAQQPPLCGSSSCQTVPSLPPQSLQPQGWRQPPGVSDLWVTSLLPAWLSSFPIPFCTKSHLLARGRGLCSWLYLLEQTWHVGRKGICHKRYWRDQRISERTKGGEVWEYKGKSSAQKRPRGTAQWSHALCMVGAGGVGGAGTVAGREAPRVPPMLDAENSHSQRCLYYCLSPESSLGISSFMKWASHLRERIGCV